MPVHTHTHTRRLRLSLSQPLLFPLPASFSLPPSYVSLSSSSCLNLSFSSSSDAPVSRLHLSHSCECRRQFLRRVRCHVTFALHPKRAGTARGGVTAEFAKVVRACCTSRVTNGSSGFYGALKARNQRERERAQFQILHGRFQLL